MGSELASVSALTLPTTTDIKRKEKTSALPEAEIPALPFRRSLVVVRNPWLHTSSAEFPLPPMDWLTILPQRSPKKTDTREDLPFASWEQPESPYSIYDNKYF